MLKNIAAISVVCAVLFLRCGQDESERTVFSEGEWHEATKPEAGVSTYFITVARDSFFLQNRLWTDIPQCNGTVCSGTQLNTFAKGTISTIPDNQMVTFSGITTDTLFSPLTDGAGNQIPFYELYLYTWIGDTLVLVMDNNERKMVKE